SNLKRYNVLGKGLDSLDAIRELKKYKSGNEFIYDIALFYNYKGNDRIHTTRTSVDLDMFFKNVYAFDNGFKEDFLNTINSASIPTMYPIENVLLNNNQSARFATYIYPIPANATKPYLVLTFFIEEEVILDILD